MRKTTIENTTYTYNDQGYILQTETKFNSGYAEVKSFLLVEMPNNPGDYYVQQEMLVFEDSETFNGGWSRTVTVITSDSAYTVFVDKQDNHGRSKEIQNFRSQPPIAMRMPSEYLEQS